MKKRNSGLDLLRIISAVAVVIIHINALWFLKGKYSGEMSHQIGAFLNLITRFSVPCFIMISGAFMLADDRNEDFRYFYQKSFKKILLPYIGLVLVWGLINFRFKVLIEGDGQAYLKSLVEGTYGNLWFMPMLICLYVMTPIFIRIRKNLDFKQITVLGIMLMIWAAVSQSTSTYQLPYSMGVVGAYTAYYIMGYILMSVSWRGRYFKIGGAIVSGILIVCTLWIREAGMALYIENPYTSFFSPTVIVISCYMFGIFKDIHIRANIEKVTGVTYYIYLLHTLVYSVISKYFMDIKPELLGMVALAAITLILSLIGGFIYKAICERFMKYAERYILSAFQ